MFMNPTTMDATTRRYWKLTSREILDQSEVARGGGGGGHGGDGSGRGGDSSGHGAGVGGDEHESLSSCSINLIGLSP